MSSICSPVATRRSRPSGPVAGHGQHLGAQRRQTPRQHDPGDVAGPAPEQISQEARTALDQRGTVDHGQQRGSPGRGGIRSSRGSLFGEQGARERLAVLRADGHQTRGAGARARAVRQPLRPVPVRDPVRVREDRDRHVRGPAPGHGLAQERARRGERRRPVALESEHPAAGQLHGDRDLRQLLRRADRGGQRGIRLLDRLGRVARPAATSADRRPSRPRTRRKSAASRRRSQSRRPGAVAR